MYKVKAKKLLFMTSFLSLSVCCVGCSVFAQELTYNYHTLSSNSIIPNDEQNLDIVDFSKQALKEIYTVNEHDYETHFLKAQEFFSTSVLEHYKNDFKENMLPELQSNQAQSSIEFNQNKLGNIVAAYDSHQKIIAWTITYPATLKQDGVKKYQVNVDVTLVVEPKNQSQSVEVNNKINNTNYIITHFEIN